MPESNSKGGRKPRVTDEDLLDVFRSTTDPVLSTAEIAEQVRIKRRGTLRRLRSLEDDDRLESKQIGGRNTVWWLPNVGATHTPTMDEGLPSTDEDVTRRTDTEPPTDAARDDGDTDALDDALAEWEPDTQADAKSARGQTRRTVEFLRDHAPERFKAGELKDALAGGSSFSRRHWWERAVQPGLRHLAGCDLVEYRTGHHDYRYTGKGS